MRAVRDGAAADGDAARGQLSDHRPTRMGRNGKVRGCSVSVRGMLTRLHIQGYKALRDIDTTLEPLTVIVGPNGCGKTSVLEAIAVARQHHHEGTCVSRVERDPCSKNDIVRGAAIALWSKEHGCLRVEPTSSWESLGPLSTRVLALNATALARPTDSLRTTPFMADDGSGLATVLASWMDGQPEKLESIDDQLREMIPNLERVRVRRAPAPVSERRAAPVMVDEIFFDFRHAKSVPAEHVGGGSLILLGLLTAASTDDTSLLLLDGIEQGLHPKAQQQLVGQLRALTERGLQIIATSHSPYLVLHLEYEEVRIMTASASGEALIGELTDHPEHARWGEDMSTSEFWTVFGEDWLSKAFAQNHGRGNEFDRLDRGV